MASTAYSSHPWSGEPRGADPEDFDLLAQDEEAYVDPWDTWDASSPDGEVESTMAPTFDDETDLDAYDEPDVAEVDDWDSADDEPGYGTGQIAAGAMVATLVLLGLDALLTGGMSFFFDLCFVVVCLVTAMATRSRDLFTAGVMPPLAFATAVIVVSIVSPESFVVGGDRFDRVILTGLVTHVGALAFGYVTTLAVVGGRMLSRRAAV